MQTTASSIPPTQSNLLKTMQPQSAQNMIMTSNKKKKYTQQQAPPPKQPQQQPQQQQQQQQPNQPPSFQISKSFNVVSMLKTNTIANAQQQHAPQPQQTLQQQQQSYANVVNRALPPVMCGGGSVVTVNNCQANADTRNSATTMFNISHRGVSNSANNNNSTLDASNAHLAATGYGVGTADVVGVGGGSVGVGVNVGINGSGVCSGSSLGGNGGVGGGGGGGGGGIIALTNSTSATHGNTLGITLGGVTGGTAYAHEKSIVGVNVGCIDSRKYDYKNTKLLSNNNFQATQEYIQSAGANNSGQLRTNQTGNIYRGPPASPAPRTNARHVPMPMYQQAMHQGVQGVVLPTFTQYPRQAYQAPQYSYTQQLQPNYYSYQPYYSMPAPQRGAVGVNTGVGISNTMSVQTGPMAGPPGSAQTQLPLAPGAVLANTVPPGTSPTAVLGVAPSSSSQQVGVPSIVNVVPANVPPQPIQRTNKQALRKHALEIIDPDTKKNILDDFVKSTDTEYSDPMYTPHPTMSMQSEIPVNPTQAEPSNMAMGTGVIMMAGEPLRNIPYEILDMHQMPQQQRDVVVGQTPVVSAISDAPSVEILPTTQKPRSKKIPIVSPKDEQTTTTQNAAQTNENLAAKQHQQSTKVLDEGTSTLKSDCVQQQLPTTHQEQQQHLQYPIHQVPQLNTQQQISTTATISADNSSSSLSKEIRIATDNIQQQKPSESVSTLITATTLSTPKSAAVTTNNPTYNAASAPSTDWFQNPTHNIADNGENSSSINRSIELQSQLLDRDLGTTTQQQQSTIISEGVPTLVNEMQLTDKGRISNTTTTTAAVTSSNKEPQPSSLASASNGGTSGSDAVSNVDGSGISLSKDENLSNNNISTNVVISANQELFKNNHHNTPFDKASSDKSNTSNTDAAPILALQKQIIASNVTRERDETDRASLQQSTTIQQHQQHSKTPPQQTTDTNSNNVEDVATDANTEMTDQQKPDNSGATDCPQVANTDAGISQKTTGVGAVQAPVITTKTPPADDESSGATLPSSTTQIPASSSTSNTVPTATTSTAAVGAQSSPVQQQPIINYNEGQWSPNNPTGKKQYDRKQLLQLREAKASHVQPEVNNVSILPQPNLMPSFVRNPKRVQSMIGPSGSNRSSGAGVMDNAGGSGAFVIKQASMSGVHGRGSMKGGMYHINLSLNQDVKLNETDNAWRPRALVKADGEVDPDAKTKREKEELIRRVRGILNKLTPEKFDALVEEIIKLKIDTPDKMEDVMILVFEKAIDEPNFSVSYARLCHRLISEVKARDERMESGTKSNLAQFRNALLDKTEREFTYNVTKSKAKEMKLQPIIEKIAKCTDPVEKAELEAQLEEEERRIRRRSGGTVRFIGELFKISMLTGKIIHSCIEALLNPNSEDMLECLCKLLTTVGSKFEQTPFNSKEVQRCYSLDKTIARMQAIASKTDKEGAKVSSRVRFMLQDVIDLRRNKWQSTRNEAPKTMEQIEKETKTEQLSSQYLNYSNSVSGAGGVGSNGPSSMSSGGKRDDRSGGGGGRFNDSRSGGGYGGSHSQRGDTGSLRRQQQGGGGGNSSTSGNHSNGNNDDSTWHVQTSKGNRSLDANKLEGLSTATQNFDTKKMGGIALFLWNPNGSRQLSTPATTPSNSFAALSSLSDTNRSNDRDRDRDRSGPRNKGSYNKGSMERDRDRYGMHSRSGSSQASRENSSSRGPQGIRGAMNSSSMQKSASHSKYTQSQMPSSNRMPTKPALSSSGSSSLYPTRGTESSSYSSSSNQLQNEVERNVVSATAPSAIFEKSSDSDERIIKSVVSEMLEIAATSQPFNAQLEQCIKRVKESQYCSLIYYIMTDYLHLQHVGKLQRRHLGFILVYLIKQNILTVDHFRLAYNQFCEVASDLALDIPELWKYFIEFSGPLISRKYISIHDLWNNQLKEDNAPDFGRRFLKTYLDYCLTEIGPSFTRTMWKKLNIKLTDFMAENEVKNFIQSNNLEYIENESIQPVIVINEHKKEHVNKVVENIEHLLKEGAPADCIIDYINGNIVDINNDIDKQFIRSLTAKLCNFAITYKDNSYKLEIDCFQKICIPVLNRYIDSKEERELECLHSMQLLVHRLEHPRGLLSDLFGELYDADVIPQDSFIKWRDSNDQSAGKGVAVKGLNPFFNHVLSSETSDENN